jgi:hypothetical protein
MRETNRSGTNIRGQEEKKIGMKGETINRGGKREEVEAENQHLGLERKKEGKEAGVELGWSNKATFPSFTPSREDLEVEESPIWLGRLMPGSWMISNCIRSKSPRSLRNVTLWL